MIFCKKTFFFLQENDIFSKKQKVLVVKNRFFDKKNVFLNFCKSVGNRQN